MIKVGLDTTLPLVCIPILVPRLNRSKAANGRLGKTVIESKTY